MDKEEKITPIVVICAWCRDGQSSVVDAHEKDDLVSHGICNDCTERVLDEFESD